MLCTASTALAGDAPEDAKLKALGPLAGKLDARLIPAVEAVRAGKSSDADAARDLKEKLGTIAKTSRADQFPIRIDAAVDDALLTKIKATGATVVSTRPLRREHDHRGGHAYADRRADPD